MVDEEQKEKEKTTISRETSSNYDAGSESETDEKVNSLNAETKRINQAIAEKANAEARAKAAGITAGPQEAPKKQEISPEEYADNAIAGKYNQNI